MENTQRNNLLVPLAIIIAGVLIAGALFFSRKDANQNGEVLGNTQERPEENMKPVSSDDHILGSPNADILLVEYSDTDCPFCQSFHTTLKKVIDEYGKESKVAWVYRHFAFHPKAPKEAEATECVAEIGGNEKFWQFLDLLFSKKDFKKQPYEGLDPKVLPDLAASVGVNKTAFIECLNSGKFAEKVAASYQDGLKAGTQGTPYTILVTKTMKIPINNGAIPYDSLKNAIQSILSGEVK